MAVRALAPRVGLVATSEVDRGERIRVRRTALGLSVSGLAKKAKVDRATVSKIEEGADGVRDATYGVIERTLDGLEQEMGMNDPDSNVVRFVVRGVYGADSLVVEGPVENIAELEKSVDRIMRRLRDHEA